MYHVLLAFQCIYGHSDGGEHEDGKEGEVSGHCLESSMQMI